MDQQKIRRIAELILVGVFLALLLAALPALGLGNLVTGFVLLAICLVLGLFIIWTKIIDEIVGGYRRTHKIISTVILLSVMLALAWGGNYYDHKEKRREVRENLKFTAALPSPDDLNKSVITVINDSHESIQYRFICHITMLVANHGHQVIQESFFANHERSGILESGSDAQADDCLSDNRFPTQALDCADIKVRLFYSLESQPDIEQEKDHGFVAKKRGDRFEWEDRATEQEISDCASLVHLPLSPEEQDAAEAQRWRSEDEKILSTRGTDSAKRMVASLSEEIFQFGENEKAIMPKPPDIEKDGMAGVMESQKEFAAWGRASSDRFHSRFGSRLNKAFELAGKATLKFDGAKTNCTIISESFPPTVSQTQRCGEVIAWIATKLP